MHNVYFRGGSVKVLYNLTFRGELSDQLKEDIRNIIDRKSSKVVGNQYEVLFLKDFVVDIRRRLGILPTTTTPGPAGKIKTSVKYTVVQAAFLQKEL